jgi:hypothetical protein
MFRLSQVVASVLLTAVLAFGNCAFCIGSSAGASRKAHSCCKPQKVELPCHKSTTPAPIEHQDGCSDQTELLENAQTVERVSLTPTFVSQPVFKVKLSLLAEPGYTFITEADRSGPSQLSSSTTPLRI